MKEIIVKSQEELDAISPEEEVQIVIRFGTKAAPAIVSKRYYSSVEAYGNSSVEARDNSSVVAWGNSSVFARGNSQITDRSQAHNISVSANARIVYDPKTALAYAEAHDLEHTDASIHLFKAVHKINGRYFSDKKMKYTIGESVTADGLTTDPSKACGHAIHMAYKPWCVDFGFAWKDLAILELEADMSGLVVPINGVGKVRALTARVVREVPLEECGVIGKTYLRRQNRKAGTEAAQ